MAPSCGHRTGGGWRLEPRSMAHTCLRLAVDRESSPIGPIGEWRFTGRSIRGSWWQGTGGPPQLQPGDVIVQVNRKPVHTTEEFRQTIENQHRGEPALFMIHRKAINLFVAVDVAEGSPQG